jgi:glycosyltransferase involved in cell wall biosynthesis
MPTFNRAQLLKSALASVLSQTYKNLEIIVVDDASTDDTQQVVAVIKDHRLRYIRHVATKGGSAARNTGILAAIGSYIAFLDDDDEWYPEKVEAQLEWLDRYDAVLCMYSMDGLDIVATDKLETVDCNELRQGFVRGGSASALIARADVLKELRFDDGLPKFQDWDLCIRIVQKYTLGCLNQSLVRYNDGAHNRISNRLRTLPLSELENELRMFDKHKEFFGERLGRQHRCKALLYGIRHRPDKLVYLLHVIGICGLGQVIQVLARRAAQKIW